MASIVIDRRVELAAVSDVRHWRQHLFACLVTDFTEETPGDFLDFHQGALRLTSLFVLNGVGSNAHRFEAFVGPFEHLFAPSVQFFLMVTPGTWRTVLC